jgi:hypothetical protein
MKNLLFFFILFLSSNALADCKFNEIEKKAISDDPASLYIAGRAYLNPDLVKEKDWYKLKDCLIKQNIELGNKYLLQSADKGYSNALVSVGWHYYTGEYGLKKDFVKSLDYNKKAAFSKLGNSQYAGAYNVGYLYYSAGVQQDLGEAAFWFDLSAKDLLRRIQFLKEKGLYNKDMDAYWTKHAYEISTEFNKYNPNPTPQMIKVRDAYLNFLRNRDDVSLTALDPLSKYYIESCTKVVDATVDRNNPKYVIYTFKSKTDKPLIITSVLLKSKNGKIMRENKKNLQLQPFGVIVGETMYVGDLNLEVAGQTYFSCRYANSSSFLPNSLNQNYYLIKIISGFVILLILIGGGYKFWYKKNN